MRNFLQRLSLALTVAVSVVTLTPSVKAQQSNPQLPSAVQQQSDMQSEGKAFTGTIMKDGKKLVLKDTAHNVSYQLDDQDKVKQFEGKLVKVTGKLDANTNQIHVDNIEPLS